MKIGFLLPWDQDIERWTSYADENGIEGIEMIYAARKKPASYEFKPEEINNAFKGKKVKVCATSMFWINTIAKDAEERAQARAMNEELIKTAEAIGSPLAIMGIGCYEEKNLAKNLEEFKSEYHYLTEYAKQHHVQIAFLIGHQPTFANTITNIKAIIEAIPDIRFKVDPVGVVRNVRADPYHTVQLLGPRIAHMHFKDFIRLPEGEVEPPVGMGEIKWNYIMAILNEAGYEGYAAIEPHGPKWGKIENYAKYISYSKRHIEQYLID